MPVYLILVIAVVVGVDRARRLIADTESPDDTEAATLGATDRWRQMARVERAMFVVMAMSGLLWLLLILPIGFAAAVAALGFAVWKRPVLEATLAPVVIAGGAAVVLFDVALTLAREPGDWGAAAVNSLLFGGLWIVIGLLMSAASRTGAHAEDPASTGSPPTDQAGPVPER